MYIHVIKIEGIAKCVNYLLAGITSQKNYIHICNTQPTTVKSRGKKLNNSYTINKQQVQL